MLKLVYGDAAVTMKTVYKWFERFRNGCESAEDEERSGRLSTSKSIHLTALIVVTVSNFTYHFST